MLKKLELKIPPVLLFFLVGSLTKAIVTLFPFYHFKSPYLIVFFLILLGSLLGFLASKEFRKQRTTINPVRPENSTALVCEGIYRFSRNPMYLSMAILLLGWGVYLQTLTSFTGLLVFTCYIDIFQIKPEERILLDKFGKTYLEYRSKTQKWW